MQHHCSVTRWMLAIAVVVSCGGATPNPPAAEPVVTKTGLGGGAKGGNPFEILFPDGGYLVGIQCHVVPSGDSFIIPVFSAKYETHEGRKWAQRYGQPRREGKKHDLMAREGYAVGAITVRGGAFHIQSLRLTFMKVTPSGLDPKESYFSDVVGAPLGATVIDSNGHFIVGVHGRSGGGNVNALGLIIADAADRAMRPGAADLKPGPLPAASMPMPTQKPGTANADPKVPLNEAPARQSEAAPLQVTIRHAEFRHGKESRDATKAFRGRAGRYLLPFEPNESNLELRTLGSREGIELTVRFAAGETELETKLPQGKTAHALVCPSDPELIEKLKQEHPKQPAVLEAFYGQGRQWTDVTARVREAFEEQRSIHAGNHLIDDTSQGGGGRTLFVAYLHDDRIELLKLDQLQREQLPPHPPITFMPLSLPAKVTSFALTEDARHLVATHREQDKISVWDVINGKLIAQRHVKAARSVMCRGDRVYVANEGEGTITVLAAKDPWQIVDELRVNQPFIMHISAARGDAFDGRLLVGTMPERPAHRGWQIELLERGSDRARVIAKNKQMAMVSADGVTVLVGSPPGNTSPSMQEATTYNFHDLITSERPTALNTDRQLINSFAYQLRPGPIWFGSHAVFAGDPLKLVSETGTLDLVIADHTRPVCYELTQGMLEAHRLLPLPLESGFRRLDWEDQLKHGFGGHILFDNQRQSVLHLDGHPSAATHHRITYLYLLDHQTGDIRHARIRDFISGEAPSLAAGKGDDLVGLFGLSTRIPSGKLFTHRLRSDLDDDAKFELLSGPEGALLQPGNLFGWMPHDSQLGVHEIKLRVIERGQARIERVEIEVIDRHLLARMGGDIARVDDHPQLPLSPDHLHLTRGHEDKSLLVLQGRTLKVLDRDGLTVRDSYELPRRYSRIAERSNAWIAIAESPLTLEVIDKPTLRVRRSIPLKARQLTDLAIHPDKQISYVAVQDRDEPPHHHIWIIDERSGEIRQSETQIGRWLAMHGSGKRLWTGISERVVGGRRLMLDLDRGLLSVPLIGNIDFMLEYEIGDNGELEATRVIEKVGGPGTGVLMSPDSRWMSLVGRHGKLPVWTTDEVAQPSLLTTDARPVQEDAPALAFHPTLPLAATVLKGQPIVYRLPDASEDERRLLLTARGLGDRQVEHMEFSPDGRHLICLCKDALGRRSLVQVGLRLEAAEQVAVNQPWQKPAPPDDPDAKPEPVKRVPIVELDGLRPTAGPLMTEKQIAQRYMDAVTVIFSDEGAGTGVFIGRTGYVLTCAHVLPRRGRVQVRYRERGRHDGHVTRQAEVIHVDQRRDLALLKIDPPAPVVFGHLAAARQKVLAGERVVVIGNPGLGDEILDYTLTVGVVSNPDRAIGDLPFIQTSAAVNPGNSGGPMFDERGQIIGIVTLKANIEGAGFAVPADDVRTFLQAATK